MILTLGGGGIRALSIIGALSNLDLSKYTKIWGLSMGSILGLLICIGYTPLELEQIVLSTNFMSLIDICDPLDFLETKGMLTMNPLKLILINLLKQKGYSSETTMLDIPRLGVVVSNITSQKPELITNSNLLVIDVVLASCCIPIIFCPYQINENLYVDGGLYVNTPAELLPETPDQTNIVLSHSEFIDISSMWGYLNAIINSPRRTKLQNWLKTHKATVLKVDGIEAMDLSISKDLLKNLMKLLV